MKNYVIIGGSSGIGRALVETLAAAGHQVIATYNKTEVNDMMANVEYHHFDVMDEGAGFDFLPDQIDGIAYCPGSINLKPFHRIKPVAFTHDFELQVGGAIKTIQAGLKNLKKADHPAIVLFSTVAVQAGFNFHSQVSTSKGAIEGLTRALAAEFAPTIRVNCIAPSLTDTPLAGKLLNSPEKMEANAQRHPLRRVGTATDIANMAAFLLSEKSSFISGQVLPVDGGMSNLKV